MVIQFMLVLVELVAAERALLIENQRYEPEKNCSPFLTACGWAEAWFVSPTPSPARS
jgi:hypothetical protein